MSDIISLKKNSAEINFQDFCLRIFAKSKGNYFDELRIWKLPKKHKVLSMFNQKNLIWAIYGDDVKKLQGWFFRDNPMFLGAIAAKIETCNSYEELQTVLVNFEKITQGK